MTDSVELTTTSVMAAAEELLARAGYQRVDVKEGLLPSSSRLYEDSYSIVTVVVYDEWAHLSRRWFEAQDALIRLMSACIRRTDPKAWEGYLVLLTPSTMDSAALSELAEIRYDTSRVRKLVAAGDELRSLADVARALAPLLPLSFLKVHEEQASALDQLPYFLSEKGVPKDAVRVLVQAFRDQQALVERLHDHRVGS